MSIRRHLRIAACDTEVLQMENSLKFAFASTDMQHVNQHFGSSRSFVIYAIDSERAVLVEVAQFEDGAQDGNENKLIEKMQVLAGCAAVYCQAVGGSAIRQLTSLGIQPVKVSENAEISELIDALQAELRDKPSTWLAQALKRQQPADHQRFDVMEAEGWQE